MLYGRALVQQQRLKLPLLNVIERVEHNGKKLRKGEMRHSSFDPYSVQLPEPKLLKQAGISSPERQGEAVLRDESSC